MRELKNWIHAKTAKAKRVRPEHDRGEEKSKKADAIRAEVELA
jgi:hypothetical protein